MSKKLVICVGVALCVLGGSGLAFGQDGVPKFQNLRWAEDWSEYPEEGIDSIFDPIKKISLGKNSWLSVGGEVRFRSEAWSDFGFDDANDDVFNLIRVFLHTDWHFGEHWRVFLQGKYTDAFSRDLPGGERDALDADHGDIWNAFIEGNYTFDRVDLTFRVGRQELQYGKQRLVSPLDWSNNRRIFDGVVVSLAGTDNPWKLDAFVTAPVITDTSGFNDPNDDVYFTGLYYSRKVGANDRFDMDAYFLSLISESDAAIDEDRYTLGVRFSGPAIFSNHLTFDVESAVQLGRQDDLDIFAWMLTAETTYMRDDVRLSPWFTLGVDIATGDDDPRDRVTATFDQLFPLGHAYLGFMDVVGRQNIIDLRATTGLWPIKKKLMVRADMHFFFVMNRADGLYNAGGGLIRRRDNKDGGKDASKLSSGGPPRKIDSVGSELDLTVKYIINRNANVQFGYSHFFAGGFIEETGTHEDIDFFYSQLTFKF